jgi:hypothetical protein
MPTRRYAITPALLITVIAISLANCATALADDPRATAKPAANPSTSASPDQFITIHNDFYCTDQAGARILTRSGCLCQFDGTFYWYGGNPRGFREQYCYTSPDLVHWTNRGVILRHDTDANRIDMLYNEKTKKYVMFLKYDGNGAYFGIATADKPEGPFTFQSKTLIDNARIGDMAIYKDDDGTAYLCYVSWAVGTNAQHGIYRLSDDYLTPDKRVYLWDIRSREAPHIFKRNGIYYYGTSKTAGIQSSGTAYYTATNLAGPWSPAKPLATPGSKNSWDSQVDFIFPFHGSNGTTYMFAGDRWIKDAAHGRNGDYVWLPVEFEGDTPTVNYYQDWDLNVAAGTWRKFDPKRNLAAGKLVTASSENGVSVAKHATESKTFEDYAGTYWESGEGDSQWLRVDLQAPTAINRVILKWNVTAAKDFKIQTSTDGEKWDDVYSTTQGSASTITDQTFPTITARYVQVVATAHAPVINNFRRGRGAATATTPPANALPAPTGYSLFDFMVLKD